jgi:hypothetical protein
VIEESRAARRAAIEAEKKDHEARLAALDASTQMKVNQYWAANLRARDRSSPDKTDLDTLVVPEPSQWRSLRQEERHAAEPRIRRDASPTERGPQGPQGSAQSTQGPERTARATARPCTEAPGRRARAPGATTKVPRRPQTLATGTWEPRRTR